MSEKQTFILTPAPHPSRRLAIQAVQQAPDGTVVTLADETRTQEQNRLLWPLLNLWAKNQKLVINGREAEAPRETWKVIFLAAFRKNHGTKPDFAIGLDGELVPLGYSTRVMGKREFADFLTFILAETTERGMDLPSRDVYEGYIGSAA